MDPVTRSGFVALAGRPNVGKSTLVNAMVGRKVAIVSDKPQTTRRAIRGVATRGRVQMVLTDLPGVQRPRDELTRRMQHRVEQELGEADAALFVVNGDQGVGGPGRPVDRRGARQRPRPRRDRGQQGRPDLEPAHRRGARRRRRAARRRDLPGLGAHGQRGRGADRPPRRAAARGPVLLPARGDLRPARVGPARRARARAGARPHAPGGPALGRGPGRGGRGPRRPARRSARCCGSRRSPRRGS